MNLKEYLNLERDDLKSGNRIASILNGVITLSLMAIVFGIPVFFTGMTFQGIQFEKMIYFYVWILVALVAWATRGIIEGELKLRRTPLDFPILGVLATYLLSTIFSIDKWHSFWGLFGDPSRGLINMLAIIAVYYLAMSNLNAKRFSLMTGSIVASNAIIAVWTTLAVFGIKFLPEALMKISPISLIGTLSGLSFYFAMMLPILMSTILSLAKRESRVWMRNIALAICFLLLVADVLFIFTLYSFVPWFATVVGISLFLVFIISRLVGVKKGWAWVPMLVFVAVMLILLTVSNFGNIKVAKINLPVEVSMDYKMSWGVAKEALKNNFFLGSGPATYGYDFSKYKSQDFNLNSFYELRFQQGTGMFFESISTVGALASITLMILVLSFVGIVFFMLSRKIPEDRSQQLGFSVSAMVFIVGIFSMRVEGVILVFGSIISILSMWSLLSVESYEKKWTTLSLKSSPKFALALAFIFTIVSAGVIFLFIFLGKVYVADAYVKKSMSVEKISHDDSIMKLSKAINIFNKESQYFIGLAQQYMVIANDEFLKKEEDRNVGLLQQYVLNATQAANMGELLSGNDITTVEAVAGIIENTIFFVPSASQIAEEKYQKALTLDPNNPMYFLKLGQLKLVQANGKKDDEKKQLIEQAKDLFQKSIDKKSNFAAGRYQLGLALDELGKSDEAINQIGAAVQIENNNVTYLFNLARLYQKRSGADDLKIAEALYKEVFKYNENELNTHVALGILYEKENKNDLAIEEYEKVLKLIPVDSKDLIAKVQSLISNVKDGKQNTFETIANKDQEITKSSESITTQSE